MRQRVGYRGVDDVVVSIHAPREGCDLSAPELFYFDIQFQFTHPGRGATCGIVLSATQHLEFQFTHPGRGATILLGKAGELWMVSIHAPREGCDLPQAYVADNATFQFTHPGRGATLDVL